MHYTYRRLPLPLGPTFTKVWENAYQLVHKLVFDFNFVTFERFRQFLHSYNRKIIICFVDIVVSCDFLCCGAAK